MTRSATEDTRPPRRVGARRLPAVLALIVASAACGNLTMGGFGEAVVVVSGDAPDSIPAPASVTWARAIEGPTGPDRADADEEDQPEGQLEAEMRLFLVGDGGSLVSLSDDEVEIRVDLEGVEEDETLPRQVPADAYTDLRIVFLEIQVQVDAGLVIDGDTITGPIDIEMESDSLVVERPLSVTIDEGRRTEIFIDLNAASWLQAVDPVTLSVSAAAFADLITIDVR